MSRHPVYTYTGCWIICEKVRKKTKTNIGHQANHLRTPQNNLGTPLGVPTPSLGSTDAANQFDRQIPLTNLIELHTNQVPFSPKDYIQQASYIFRLLQTASIDSSLL